MKCDKKNMLLYAVTDRTWTLNHTLYEQVEEALKGGITCLQLREKNLSASEFYNEAIEIKALCKKYNIPFIVNDNVEIAVKCGADGVHIGQEDMNVRSVRKIIGENMLLGASVQTVEQAKKAQEDGADYLGVGAVFPTSTKNDAIDVPIAVLKDICNSVAIPVTAIGGIKKDNIALLAGSGVDGIAVISAIFASVDIKRECEELRKITEEMLEG